MNSSPAPTTPLHAVLIGTGNMSVAHIKALDATDHFQLVAICDANPENLASAEVADEVARYTDMEEMLSHQAADLVIIVTPNTSHAALTIAAAQHQPQAILCEKPMSTHYYDALAMVETCEKSGSELLINHQRRLVAGAVGRKAITDGLIGELLEVKGYSAGDFLSDGTHTVDALLNFGGDIAPQFVLGAVDMNSERGTRYGHGVENSTTATWLSPDFVRFEASSGAINRRYPYQSYRVTGTKGELWHPGGEMQPQWFINDGKPGDHAVSTGEDGWHPLPTPSQEGPWRRIVQAGEPIDPMVISLELLADRLAGGDVPHPLNGRRTLLVQEIINATYLSALENRRVELPLPKDTPFVIDALANTPKKHL